MARSGWIKPETAEHLSDHVSLGGEILHNLLPPRRQRTNPRVVKRKMSGWPLKRTPKPLK
jgi:hypothetical protein